MKNKITRIFKLFIWLFIGTFLFIFRFRQIYSVWNYTYESKLIKSGFKKFSLFLMFFGTLLANVIVWILIWWIVG
jgi:hypothetical protein